MGDSIYISSLPGLSAAGLYLLQNEKRADSPLELRAVAQHRSPNLDYFQYRESFARLNSAIDVSDGLLTDAGHVAGSSKVRINLDLQVLRDSELKRIDEEKYLDWVLNGGEDHVLLGTSGEVVPGFIKIGEVVSGSGVTLDGNEIAAGGYTHSWK